MKINGTVRIRRGEGDTFIGQIEDIEYYKDEGYEILETEPDLTGRELARHFDEDAESGNYHSLVGIHEWLYDIIASTTHDFGVAKLIMETIGEKYGGIHLFK